MLPHLLAKVGRHGRVCETRYSPSPPSDTTCSYTYNADPIRMRFSDARKLFQHHDDDVAIQQWLIALPDAKPALGNDIDSWPSDGPTLVPRDLPRRYNKSWRRCLTLLSCGGEGSRLSAEPGTERLFEKVYAPEKPQATPEATDCCLPKRRQAREEHAKGCTDRRDIDSDCDAPTKLRQLTSDHFSSRLAPRSRVPESLIHGERYRHLNKSCDSENRSGELFKCTCDGSARLTYQVNCPIGVVARCTSGLVLQMLSPPPGT